MMTEKKSFADQSEIQICTTETVYIWYEADKLNKLTKLGPARISRYVYMRLWFGSLSVKCSGILVATSGSALQAIIT